MKMPVHTSLFSACLLRHWSFLAPIRVFCNADVDCWSSSVCINIILLNALANQSLNGDISASSFMRPCSLSLVLKFPIQCGYINFQRGFNGLSTRTQKARKIPWKDDENALECCKLKSSLSSLSSLSSIRKHRPHNSPPLDKCISHPRHLLLTQKSDGLDTRPNVVSAFQIITSILSRVRNLDPTIMIIIYTLYLYSRGSEELLRAARQLLYTCTIHAPCSTPLRTVVLRSCWPALVIQATGHCRASGVWKTWGLSGHW